MSQSQAINILADSQETFDLANLLKRNPGYVPTIKNPMIAAALKALGYKAWNPKTGKNW